MLFYGHDGARTSDGVELTSLPLTLVLMLVLLVPSLVSQVKASSTDKPS